MAKKPERRSLQFDSLNDAVADIEQLATGQVQTTGNHSFGQIINHLALSLDMSTGKVQAPSPPWYMKTILFFVKPLLLNDKPLRPGVNLPKAGEDFFWPDREFDIADATEHFKGAVAYYHEHGPLEKHPVFGKVTREQNDSLNRRHCAMHLSFVHPVA